MNGRRGTVVLLAVTLVAITVGAGCLGQGGGPQTVNDTVSAPSDGQDRRPDAPAEGEDGSQTDESEDATSPSDGTADGPDENGGSSVAADGDENATVADTDSDEPERPPNAPESIDERAAARNVYRGVDDYRQQLGFRALQRSRGLAVGGAATTNDRLVVEGPEPPFVVRGTAMNMSTDEILTLLRDQGASSCTGRSKDRAGLLSAARDITALHTGPGFPEPIPELLADEVVSSWRSESSTKPVLEGGYRLGGADVRYESSTGVVYVTVALC